MVWYGVVAFKTNLKPYWGCFNILSPKIRFKKTHLKTRSAGIPLATLDFCAFKFGVKTSTKHITHQVMPLRMALYQVTRTGKKTLELQKSTVLKPNHQKLRICLRRLNSKKVLKTYSPPMFMNKTLHNITLNSDLEKSVTKPAKPTHLFFVNE